MSAVKLSMQTQRIEYRVNLSVSKEMFLILFLKVFSFLIWMNLKNWIAVQRVLVF